MYTGRVDVMGARRCTVSRRTWHLEEEEPAPFLGLVGLAVVEAHACWARDGQPRMDGRETIPVKPIHDFLDTSDETGSCSIPDRALEKWGRPFDIVKPSSRRTCCFTRGAVHTPTLERGVSQSSLGYTKMAERSGSVLQMNEKLDVSPVHATPTQPPSAY